MEVYLTKQGSLSRRGRPCRMSGAGIEAARLADRERARLAADTRTIGEKVSAGQFGGRRTDNVPPQDLGNGKRSGSSSALTNRGSA